MKNIESYLSHSRTHLANERTLLAYLRTGLAFIALGVFSARFLDYYYIAGASVAVGVSFFIYGAYRFFSERRKINKI
jgi:putative membrane protein